MLHALVVKAASTVVTGAVGVAAYEGVKKLVGKTPVRGAAVTATAWGLRGVRKAEEGAESARLAVSDVVAEANLALSRQFRFAPVSVMKKGAPNWENKAC